MSTLEAKLHELEPNPYIDRKDEFVTTPKLSRIIEIALEDLEEAEKNNVKINMASWLVYVRPPVYKPWAETQCYACFAGCVMKNTFNAKGPGYVTSLISHTFKREYSYGVGHHGPNANVVAARMYALDSIRSGNPVSAWENMYATSSVPDWVGKAPAVTSYNSDNENFKKGIRANIEFFRARGY